eukprot:g15802.t1
MFSMTEVANMFASKQHLAAVLSQMAATPAPADQLAALPLDDRVDFTKVPVLPLQCARLKPPTYAPLQPPALASFHNQPASAPGKHGVPFEASGQTAKAAPPAPPLPSYPPADAPRRDIISYLQGNSMCYKQVFSGKCTRPNCRYRHDTVPPGFYTEVSRERRQDGAPPRQVVASLSEASYEFAVEMGLFATLTRDSELERLAAPPAKPQMPSYHDIAWEDDSTLEWKVRPVADKRFNVKGFTSRVVEAAPIGPVPQDRQLVMIVPSDRFDLGQGAQVGVARSVCWWDPVENANLGTLGALQKDQIVTVIIRFIEEEFLGMVIDSTGIRPAPSKLAAIAEMSRPTNVEELRTFLGMTGYLRQFVPLYSVTAAPLTNILRHKEFASKRARKLRIPWGEDEDKAFRMLRKSLSSPLVLAFPDMNSTFELHTDASSVGAGATLMQAVGDVPRVISFASHRWSRTDSRRGPTERECMAILWAVDHFKPYLAGRPFKLVTDCSALTWLFRSRELCPKLHRWALRLMEYDIVMVWKSGVEHVLPDTLSRLPHSAAPQHDIDDSFPDDATSGAPSDYVGPRGPTLDGVPLADLETFSPDEPDVVMVTNDVDEPMIASLQALPFASCASLESQPAGLRRSGRSRAPSVRLRPPGEPPLPLPDLPVSATRQPYSPTEVDSVLAEPAALDPVTDDADVEQVLDAGGDVLSSSSGQAISSSALPAFEAARKLLSDPAALALRQQDDAELAQRPNSRRVAMLPGRPLIPWDELQMDLLRIDVPSQSGEAENTRGLDNFVEQRRQNMLEVRRVMERRNELRMAAREKANASISRPSAGVSADRGSLVLVRTPASLKHRDHRGMKLQHDAYTGPWTVVEVLEKGLSVQVEMKGLRPRSRRVSVADVKPFHVRPVRLRHDIANEFAQHVWGADFKLPESSDQLPEYQSLVECRQVATQGGRVRWEFKGLTASGTVSEWQKESKMLETFTPLQLDGFVALWHLYNPDVPVLKPSPPPNSLSRSEALRMFPIGFVVWKQFPDGTRLKGQVYDFKTPYWRVRYQEGIWEDLTRTELQKLGRPKTAA